MTYYQESGLLFTGHGDERKRSMPRPPRSTSKFISLTLFVLGLLFFLCSLLMLFPAPTDWLMAAAVVSGEWGHFSALVSLVLAAVTLRRGTAGKIVAVLALISAALFLTPLIRAMKIVRVLPARCDAAFASHAETTASPFRLPQLFRGVSTDDVQVRELVYAKNGKKDLKLDLYQPATRATSRPLLITIHGGAWSRGNRRQLPAINYALTRRGYDVVAIDYRHTPKWQFPAAIDDTFRAIDYLKTNAADLQLDVSRIVLLGRSAGGQIALFAAYAGKEPAIRGVIAFYAPADLVLGYDNPSAPGVLDSKRVLENYLGGTPAEKPTEYRAASPLNQVGAGTPPTLLIHGQLDSVVWPVHSQLLAERLTQARVPHLYLSLPWATHVCEVNLNGPSGQLSLYAIDRFLAAVMR